DLGKSRGQKLAAGSDLFGRGLVLRRYAAHRIRDPAVDQFESIVGMGAVFTPCKAKLVKCLVKQYAGIVAGERAAGAIGALESGREADNQHACIDWAERGNR